MTRYQSRTYRHKISRTDLDAFGVRVKETDLFIRGDRRLEEEAKDVVFMVREQIESYIEQYPDFATSLIPLDDDPFAPLIVREMLTAGKKAGVGPMAAVAGAIAEHVGRRLLVHGNEVIVENGGDIFAKVDKPLTVGIFAGRSPLSNKLGIQVLPEETPVGICSSSSTVGHSLSYGMADIACIMSRSTALADAAATALGNRARNKKEIEAALLWSKSLSEVLGGLVIIGEQIGMWGSVRLVNI